MMDRNSTEKGSTLPSATDQVIVELKAHATRVGDLRKLFQLRQQVNDLAINPPAGLTDAEIGLTSVRPPTIVIRLWWREFEAVQEWAEGSTAWIWGQFHPGSWGTAFRQHVYAVGQPIAAPGEEIDREFKQASGPLLD